MASVEELILAAKAGQTRSPFAQLLESAMTGYNQGVEQRDRRIDTNLKLLQMQQLQQEEEYQAKERAALAKAEEETTQNNLRNVGGSGTPVMPKQKLEKTTSVDSKGKISKSYKQVDVVPTETQELNRQRMENLQEERESRRKERRSDERVKLVDRFNADASVKKSQQSIDAANTIRGLVDSNNPIAAAAIPTFMARASGEVGNLSEADKRPFGGSQAIIQRLNAAATQAATGRLTPENARFVSELSVIMEKRAGENMDKLAQLRSKQYGKASEFLDEEDIFAVLRPDSIETTGNNAVSENETPEQRKARLMKELQEAK